MIAPPLRPQIPQLHALTGLRGIAAWFVVFYHLRPAATGILPPMLIEALAKGYLAVDLFFMLSGFVLWLNYGARLRLEGWAAAPRFWWKRVARIWPLHLAMLATMVVGVALIAATGRTGESYPLAELPLHALLVQNWGFTDALSWNYPAWSISTELFAYLLFPAIVLASRWEALSPRYLVGTVAGLALALYLFFEWHGLSRLGDAIPQTGLVRCVLQFVIGMALAILWEAWREEPRRAALCALAGAALLAGGLILGRPETAFVPLAFAALLLALALDRGPLSRLLASRPLRALGDWSYATYLSHVVLFTAYKVVATGADGQLGWATLVAFLAIELAVSALLFRWLEKPAQAALNAAMPAGIRGTRQPASH